MGSPDRALDRAIEITGSVTQLAARCGVVQSAVSNWRQRGRVPVHRCRDVVRAVHGAVSLSDLRPDIWPPEEARDAA